MPPVLDRPSVGVVRPGTHRQISAPSASRCQVARRTGFAAASNSALVVSTSSVLGAGRAGVAMVMSLSSLVTNSSVRTCLRPKLCSKCRDYSVVCVSHTTGDSSSFANCAHRYGQVVSDGRWSPTQRGHEPGDRRRTRFETERFAVPLLAPFVDGEGGVNESGESRGVPHRLRPTAPRREPQKVQKGHQELASAALLRSEETRTKELRNIHTDAIPWGVTESSFPAT